MREERHILLNVRQDVSNNSPAQDCGRARLRDEMSSVPQESQQETRISREPQMVQDDVDKCYIVENTRNTQVWFDDVLVCECSNSNGSHVPQMICGFFNALPYWDTLLQYKDKERAKEFALSSIASFVEEANKKW